jgi:DNA-binding transcriptional LysR family regulator
MNFRNLDLNLLRVFDAVMSERNLTRAAQRLSLTQSAVSNSLKRLREAVGEDLLTRAAFGVRPTPRAEALWPVVRRALGDLNEALEPGGFDPKQKSVAFRIATGDAVAATLLPSLVAQIEAERALTNLRLMPLTTREPQQLLERGEAELAVGHFPETIAGLSAAGPAALLRHQRLYESEYVCVMRRGHPLAEGELTLDRFCAAHHLLVSFSGRAHGFVDEALRSLQRTRRIVLTVNQFFTAGRVVAHSDLLTVLPAFFIAATGYQHELVRRAVPLNLAGIHVDMVWHMRDDRAHAHQWLRSRILEAVAPTRAPPHGPHD